MTQAQTLEQIMAAHPVNIPQPVLYEGQAPRVICVTSGKGGVGKTNIATNLAFALARKKKKVLILDADLNLANIDVLLGLTPKFNINHVLNGEKELEKVLIDGPGGFKILPATSGVLELSELSETQKIHFLSEMEMLGRNLDFMIIDTAAGINNNVIYFNLAAQERIVVLTPEPTSLTDAYALIKVLANRHDVKKFRILVNFARSAKEAITVFKKLSMVADRFLDTLSLDYLGHIPIDQKLPAAVRCQKLVSEIYPTSPAAKTFAKLSNQIIDEDPDELMDGNIKFFWKGVLDM